jgi:hypothetical protein
MWSPSVSGLMSALGLDLVTVGGIVIGLVALEYGFGVVRGLIEGSVDREWADHTGRGHHLGDDGKWYNRSENRVR